LGICLPIFEYVASLSRFIDHFTDKIYIAKVMEVKPSDLESPKAKIKDKKSKKPLNLYNDKPQVQHTVPVHRPTMGEIPDELRHGVKDIVINALSRGGRHNQKYLQHKLEESRFMNKYLERYLLLDQLGFLNDHAKFALTYGMLLFEANTLPELVQRPSKLPVEENKT